MDKIEITIGILSAIAAVFKWIYEYTNKLRWEKNKFLLDQIEKFQSLESTQLMEKLLDWNSISVEIKGTHYKITDEILLEAFKGYKY